MGLSETGRQDARAGRARAAALRPALLSVVLVLSALVATVAASAAAPGSRPVPAAEVLLLLVALILAGALQLQIRYSDEVDATDLFDVVVAPALLVLAPPVAVLVAVGAKAVSQALLRVAPVKAIFNTAQWGCAVACGALALALLRDDAGAARVSDLAALAVALVAVAVVNHLAVAAVLRLVSPPRIGPDPADPRSIADADVGHRLALDLAAFGVNLCFGLLLSAAYLETAWLLPLGLLPLVALHRAQRLAADRAADRTRVGELRAASRTLLDDDPDQAVPRFLEQIRRGLGAEAVELIRTEGSGIGLDRVAAGEPYQHRDVPADAVDEGHRLLLAMNDVLLVPPDPIPGELVDALPGPSRNLLVAPLELAGTRAVLCVHDRSGLRGFGSHLREVFEQLARELSGALVRAEATRRAEAERSRFTALVRGSSDLVLVLDAGTVVRYASAAADRVLGLDPAALVDRPLAEALSYGQSGEIRRWIAETVADPARIASIDLELPESGRLSRHIQAISRNLLDDPAVEGIVVNVRDVSEARRAAALMRRQAAVLELIAADAPLPQTLQLVALTVEEMVPGAHCVVHVGGPDGRQTVPAGEAGVLAGRVCERLAADIAALLEATDGPDTGRTARTGPVVLPDLAGDPGGLSADLTGSLADQDVRACWIWPLVGPGVGRADGSLNVLFADPRGPADAEHRIVDLAAKLASNAVNQHRERRQLAYQATHDGLTGLASRAVLRDRIERALARMPRSSATVAVLFVDLDNFKIINDSLGHRVGDALLREISTRLLSLVRPTDTVARLGGDEFVVLCGDLAGVEDAVVVAQRLLGLLTEPVTVNGHEFFVTASLGIAVADGAEPDPDLLIENADAAMYRAKARGGNQYRLFDTGMRSGAARRLETRTSLRQALDRGELAVHYQPTVDLVTGRLSGVEALVRWEHPQRGLLSPADFIPLAEETGMIVPIGALVLLESCRQVARWRDERPDALLELSVNLSPRQFLTGGLVQTVQAALEETGLEPGSLSLEITESCLMEDAVDIRQSLADLKRVGVRLAIDDFGTGYSSLSYLKQLPVDTLKLDQSFVRNVAADGPDRAIAEMVMGLGRTLGLRTVAEGIETGGQLRVLTGLGCDVGQGYYLGRPVPSERLVLDLRTPPAVAD